MSLRRHQTPVQPNNSVIDFAHGCAPTHNNDAQILLLRSEINALKEQNNQAQLLKEQSLKLDTVLQHSSKTQNLEAKLESITQSLQTSKTNDSTTQKLISRITQLESAIAENTINNRQRDVTGENAALRKLTQLETRVSALMTEKQKPEVQCLQQQKANVQLLQSKMPTVKATPEMLINEYIRRDKLERAYNEHVNNSKS